MRIWNQILSWPKDRACRLFPDVIGRRGLRRSMKRVSRCFSGEVRPVLVHTIGKVGSTAIHHAIAKQPGHRSFQTHFISEAGVAESRRCLLEHGKDPIHLNIGDRLREEMRKHPAKEVFVISLVRDPVARAVSSLFENSEFIIPGGDLKKLPLDEIIATAAALVEQSVECTESWFDQELSAVFGFDFFASDFDREAGFQIDHHGRIRLLTGKLEQLSGRGEAMLGEFLGLGEAVPIPKRRQRDGTGEGSIYSQVLESLRLPPALLDKAYQSRVCLHFYTPEEIAIFRQKWE